MIVHGLTKETNTAGLQDVLEAVLGGATKMDIAASTAPEETAELHAEDTPEHVSDAPEVTH